MGGSIFRTGQNPNVVRVDGPRIASPALTGPLAAGVHSGHVEPRFAVICWERRYQRHGVAAIATNSPTDKNNVACFIITVVAVTSTDIWLKDRKESLTWAFGVSPVCGISCCLCSNLLAAGNGCWCTGGRIGYAGTWLYFSGNHYRIVHHLANH